jgi:DNA-binding NtrC family response regulator
LIDTALIVDDEFLVRQMLEETVLRAGLDVHSAGSGSEAIEALKKNDIQIAFVDLKMKKINGMEVLKYCCEKKPEVLVVIMTAYGTVEDAVKAMKIGAFDFVLKPFTPDQVEVVLDKAREWFRLNARHQYFQTELIGKSSRKEFFSSAIGNSHKMQEVKHLIRRVAGTGSSVLISGESGTGKELAAAEIELISNPNRTRPYIRINCAAVPEKLLESELFGHEKGAFTGALERRIGRFELADGGTLLLDEISEISVEMQAKLLRAIQESEFERVGGNKTIKVNTRIIATTNRDLRKEVAEGNFREDLYYRLNVFPICLPPLRERENDIVELGNYFLYRQNTKLKKDLFFTPDALEKMIRYNWPGNVRELENIVERVAILSDGPEINRQMLPFDIQNYSEECPMIDCGNIGRDIFDLKEIERFTIMSALNRTGGNQTKAARLLGFSRRTLINKLNQYTSEVCV